MQQDTLKNTNDVIFPLIIESWRFSQVMQKAVQELPKERKRRYEGRLEWYIKKLNDSLEALDCHVEDYAGRKYEPGMPLTILNLDEFQEDDEITIENMIEPVIIGNDGTVIKTGTAMGRKG